MHIDEATRHLGAHLRAHHAGQEPWPESAPDGPGPRALRLGDIVVSLHPTSDDTGFLLESRLGQLRPDLPALASLAGELLSGHAALSAHGAGVLSLDMQGQAFLTHRFDGECLGSAQFLDTLERFIRRATHWQQRLAQAGQPAQEATQRLAALPCPGVAA